MSYSSTKEAKAGGVPWVQCCLDYIVDSRAAWAILWDPVSKQNKKIKSILAACCRCLSLSGSRCSIHTTCWEGPIPHPLSWDVIYCSMGYLRPLDPSSMVTFLFRVAGVLNTSQSCPGSGTFRVVPVSLDWTPIFLRCGRALVPPTLCPQ